MPLAMRQEELREHTDTAPHGLANELTDDPTVQTPPSLSAAGPPSVGKRRIGSYLFFILGLTAAIALVLSAILLKRWALLGLGLMVFAPFAIFLLAPVWLATSTKIAQDDAVRREQPPAEPRLDRGPDTRRQ